MIKKLKIAIDIDEVIADGTKSICDQINELNGTTFTPLDWHSVKRPYDGFYVDFPIRQNLTFGTEYLRSDMTLDQSHVPLKDGVLDVLPSLLSNYKVYVITSRKLAWKGETLRWLNSTFGEVFEGVVFAREHAHGPEKMDICHELAINYMIDDRVEFLSTDTSPYVQPVLFGDYAWHQVVPEHFVHCKSWRELGEFFERELEKQS